MKNYELRLRNGLVVAHITCAEIGQGQSPWLRNLLDEKGKLMAVMYLAHHMELVEAEPSGAADKSSPTTQSPGDSPKA